MDDQNEPANLTPDLTTIGIDEIEPGVCEDTSNNRRLLRAHKFSWQRIYNDGLITNQLRALSPEMMDRVNDAIIEQKSPLLEDIRDPNSDYIIEEDLLLLTDVENYVPNWVLDRTRKWLGVKRRLEDGELTRSTLFEAPHRCNFVKTNGRRCVLWSRGNEMLGMCRTHNKAGVPDATRRAKMAMEQVAETRLRIQEISMQALDVVEDLIHDPDSGAPTRLRAAEAIWDRAGLRGGSELDVKLEQVDPAEEVRKRLLKLTQMREINTEPAHPIQIQIQDPQPEIILLPESDTE